VAPFHEFQMTSITGETVHFSQFAGKVCLVVNVASR
jgi:glutathione peroxidase-family protein